MTQIAAPLEQAFPRKIYIIAALIGFALFALTYDLRVYGAAVVDHPLMWGLNSIARHSRILDNLVVAITSFEMFQGAPLVALAVGAFFAADRADTKVRLIVGTLAAAAAAVASRVLQVFMPNLPRPMADPALHFVLPHGASTGLSDWSSFPSDHAALLWGIAIATFIANRRIGYIAFAAAAVSQLARVYCGMHYPTDLLGGALLGGAMVCLATWLVGGWEDRLAAFGRARPALCAVVAFMVAGQMASLFDEVRELGVVGVYVLKKDYLRSLPADARLPGGSG